ncbi:hypothetical protein MKZ38_003668 [Zalerion maritima]|uniref:Endothelin-converting enzyme 1 n=1 Tax=Zalerion maritima TaxID=339359 RepID=A0AAD5WRM3_9PEZI|nr:hypothetical protein MKZ38_003668 [Zalerion maritima]
MFSELEDDAFRIVKRILEDGFPKKSDHPEHSPGNMKAEVSDVDKENYDMMVEIYDACMDMSAIEETGSEPLSLILQDLIDIYPDNNSDKSWFAEANLYFERLAWGTVLNIGPGLDDMNPETLVINIFPPSLVTLPANHYYLDEKVTAAYTHAIKDSLFAILPGNTSDEEASTRAANLVEFEAFLARAAPPESLRSEVEDTIELAPVLGLDKLVEDQAPEDYDYKNKELITAFPEYLTNVSDIIDHTSSRTLKDFFLWQAVSAFSGKVHAPELVAYHDFKAELSGLDPSATPERWENCADHVKDSLDWILGRFYAEQAFSQGAQDFGEQIIGEVKKQYVTRFSEAKWMDDETRKLAKNKLEKTLVQIGYPKKSPDTADPKSLKEYYKGLEITSSFFNNTLALERFAARRSWSKLSKPADRKEWSMSPATVNAYNNPPQNKVVFPAAIMQFPVFDAELPSYVSYGAFGSVAGHEISHSFDDSGRKFDETGAYSSWWSNSTIDGFEKRAKCFVDQYSNFTVPNPDGGKPVPLDGVLTLGEVLADTGGLKVSYAAWDARRKEHPDKSLPGLEHFTHEQLFFIFFGMWYCEEQRPESMASQVVTDPHPPGMYRIKGTLQNSRAFREAFDCPVKEPTCELW